MRRDCHVLLICDDEIATHELKRALGAELLVSQTLEGLAPVTFDLRFEPVVLGAAWEIDLREKRYDLCVVAVKGDSPARFLSAEALNRDRVAASLFLVDSTLEARGQWRLRPGCDHVLARPFTDRELTLAVERLLLGSLRREARAVRDDELVGLLKALVGADRRTIEPALSPEHADGARWPAVGNHLGPLVDESGVLERLCGLGLAKRVLRQRLRTCPGCEGVALAYGETCAACGSVDFTQETMIHHFACAHVDTLTAFRRGVALVCPKCSKQLRQIGRDYEKPTGLYRCRACSAVSSDTRVVATCLSCRTRCAPEETHERVFHAYQLTALADEAVAAGNLGGFDLAGVLRDNGNGLYAKSFVVYELKRELARFRRYGAACSLIMTRLANLAEVRLRAPERTGEYIQALARAVTQDLRDLDLTAVWSGDTLATLLPMTGAEGATVVAARIEKAARACADAFELDLPAVGVARATAATGLDTVDAILRACDETLGGDGTGDIGTSAGTGTDQYVVLDDDTAQFS